MKNFKKILALVVAMVMIIGTMNMMAFADTVGQLNVNNTLTVSGLDNGDKVTVYQVLKWDENSTTGWIYSNGVTGQTTELDTLLPATNGGNTISSAIAGDLASHLGSAYGTAGETVSGTSWTRSNVDAGLYMVIVEPATAGTVYNPIFVAANYYGGGSTDPADSANSIAVSANKPSYNDSAMAKKTTIPLDKKSKAKDDNSGKVTGTENYSYTTDVGEEIDFEVTTHVPHYSADYTNPVFSLTDTLNGLALTGANVSVFLYDAATETTGAALDSSYYTITGNEADSTSYTISFKADYMKGENIPATGQGIIIKYTAKVTDKAEAVVNQDKNTVDLKFSTKPSDTTGAGRLRDQTNHFTFSLDADLLGHDEIQGSSTEAIKVGVDKDGNYIVESSTYAWSQQKHGPLEGAEFKLYTDEACDNLYKNALYPDGVIVNSDATGRITIKGLDVGEYWLKETKAPAGYIKMQDAVKVTITADISEEIEVVEEVENGSPITVTYKTNKLNSYKVQVGDVETNYTIENSKVTAVSANRAVPSSDAELKNTKGVELPSTGGIGTTIFYIIGAVLVLGAGILLVTRRRVNAN